MNQPPFYRPVYLAGPTASGKTGVAMELARRLGRAEIVNADAFQIYSGIEILAASPSKKEKEEVPHHLFGIFPLDRECSAAEFSILARMSINEVAARAIPIVVGGSGLYLKSITHGLAPTPPGDEGLRRELETFSLEQLAARYTQLDPEGAAQTNLKNRRYVSRNLEICLLTGQPASLLKKGWEDDAPSFSGTYLDRPREEIYRRINERAGRMFAAGVDAEIAAIAVNLSSTASKAIGLREIQAFLAGEMTKEACVAAIQQITRRYAKRQETWFRREALFRRIPCQEEDNDGQIVDRIQETFSLSGLMATSETAPWPDLKKAATVPD